MAQRKETKTKIKIRDLKPKKDVKGMTVRSPQCGFYVCLPIS